MKIGFYPKLAFRDIRINRKVVAPYILTCTGMVTMFYLILFLAVSDVISSMRGAETMRQIFALGSWVIAVFACIFLFYTNSFLMRRRKKEFGLYNVLGMGKRNIACILFWETFFIGAIALGAGMFSGMALSRLAELGLIRMIHGKVAYEWSFSLLPLKRCVQIFGLIFILLFLNSVGQIRFSGAVALMRSENVGEKAPKGNRLLGLLGVLLLSVAYYLAIKIQNPIAALTVFFLAVVMVIGGTYLVMIAGSVSFCRLLQKNKRYYYQTKHFISVSSMVYRMKRNGAGLASICVLATMVLVMMASSACLYFGEESAIRERFPRQINLEFHVTETDGLSEQGIRALQETIRSELETRNVVVQNDFSYRVVGLYGVLQDHYVDWNAGLESVLQPYTSSVEELQRFCFVPLEDYNAMMGTNETLAPGEALCYLSQGRYEGDTITFQHGNTFRIQKQVDHFIEPFNTDRNLIPSLVLIVPDLAESMEGLDKLADFGGERNLEMGWIWNFDTGLEPDEQITLYGELDEVLTDIALKERLGYSSCYADCQAWERNNFYEMYGALFYIGMILSAVFLLAAVLIIYYKQISEGYEDRLRFEIMQKVGLTKNEIKKSVNSQLLTVFSLPLVLAALHLCFAFPMLRRLLMLFNLVDVSLFVVTTGVSFLVFGVFYAVVYKITSNVYYRIVSEGGEDL